MTLNARLHDKRKEAGHSIHQMNQAAGVRCKASCTDCRPKVVLVPAGAADGVGDEDPF